MSEKRVPRWVVDYLDKWRGLLHLQHWETQTSLSPHPDGDEDTKACTYLYPNVLTAVITIRDDVPEELTAAGDREAEDWQKTIIHELLHVFIGRITDYLEKDIWPELSPSARRIAEATLEREVEPVVELMAHILYELEAKHETEIEENGYRAIIALDGAGSEAGELPASWHY